MHEGYPPCMQVDPTIFIATLGSILEIAFDVATQSSQLGTYLMMPTGEQSDFQ
jgi:hypothetical protein